MSIPGPLDTLTSGLASIARLPTGTTVRDDCNNRDSDSNTRLVKLYDVENNVQCRRVREVISELDLNVETVIPSGVGSSVWDTELKVLIGQNNDSSRSNSLLLPRLVVMESVSDEEQEDRVLQGAEDIIAYLEETFTTKPTSSSTTTEESTNDIPDWTSYISTLLRIGRGTSVSPAAIMPSTAASSSNYKPLILYNYEHNQFCRLVREVLTELDLPYEVRSAGKGSPRRSELAKITGGSTQCPYLIDPNTDTQMADSKDIVAYLYKNYAKYTPPGELLQFVSAIITPLLRPIYAKLAPIQAGDDLDVANVQLSIESEINSHKLVVYTYRLSPFCTEAMDVLRRLDIPFEEICLGWEWVPFLIDQSGAEKRAVLGEMTGQTSLPHIFVNGKSIGGLFSGTPGLVPSLEDGSFRTFMEESTYKNEKAPETNDVESDSVSTVV